MPSLADFTPAGLEGTFAIAGAGWGGQAPMAFIGTLTFEHGGTVSGSILCNVPGASYKERRFHHMKHDGTFIIEANGMGAIRWSHGDESRFAPTRTLAPNGTVTIEELSLINRDLDQTTGALGTASATRLPRDGEFSNASLRGTYVGTAIGRGGQSPGAGLGLVTYDGQGHFSETNIANIQANSPRKRMFAAGSDQGTYTVRADGTGIIAGGGVAFMITRAVVASNTRIAQEYAFIVKDVVPATGSHFTGITTRLLD
jgi:hypothetical protein